MKRKEIIEALEKGFDYDKEKYISALMKLGILHWAEGSLRWKE